MVGLAILGVLLLPAISSGSGLHEASVSSVALVPGLPAESATIRSCTSFSATEPCSLKNAERPSTALRVRTAETADAESAPAETPDPTPTAEPLPTMAVRPGDTLLAIASWFGLTPFDIATANGMPVDDYLQIGQVLTIPVPASEFSLPPDPNAYMAAATVETAAEDPGPAAVPQPQATPEPTPAPTARPYIAPPSADEIVAIICSLPWPCEQMVRIAACESGLNPRSMNPAGYYGLFQISNQIDNWDDALTNATFAYNYKYLPALARGDGLTPWPVCRYY